MEEIKKIAEARTLEVIKAELKDSVDKYNMSEVAETRNMLALEHKKLCDEYNLTSLLTSYALFLEDQLPLVALGKALTYDTISTKDNKHDEVVNGVKRTIFTRSINESPKMLSIQKFIEWAGEKNRQLATDKFWIEKYGAAREEALRQWKRFWSSTGESTKFEVGKMRRALQSMFDALVFVAGPSGKNSLVANGDMAKYVLGIANKAKDDLEKKKFTVVTMSSSMWDQITMKVWHMVCEKKDYTVLLGDEKEETEQDTNEENTTDTSATTESTTDNK